MIGTVAYRHCYCSSTLISLAYIQRTPSLHLHPVTREEMCLWSGVGRLLKEWRWRSLLFLLFPLLLHQCEGARLFPPIRSASLRYCHVAEAEAGVDHSPSPTLWLMGFHQVSGGRRTAVRRSTEATHSLLSRGVLEEFLE